MCCYVIFGAIVHKRNRFFHLCEICEKYLKQDNRIVLITKKNQGLAASRNEGLKVAKGKYIMFIDSDDLLVYEDSLELLSYDIENYDMAKRNDCYRIY